MEKKETPAKGEWNGFSRYFKHYRTGVIYDAHDYGYKAWPIGSGA